MIKFSTLAAKQFRNYLELPAANDTGIMLWDSVVMLVKGFVGIILQILSLVVWVLGFALLPATIPMRVANERKQVRKQMAKLTAWAAAETSAKALEQKANILRRNVTRFDRNDQILLKDAAERGLALVEKRLTEV